MALSSKTSLVNCLANRLWNGCYGRDYVHQLKVTYGCWLFRLSSYQPTREEGEEKGRFSKEIHIATYSCVDNNQVDRHCASHVCQLSISIATLTRFDFNPSLFFLMTFQKGGLW